LRQPLSLSAQERGRRCPAPAVFDPNGAARTLDAIQRRVLGVLIGKAKTTGDHMMTVNAIVSG
jgi:hypothetical protein